MIVLRFGENMLRRPLAFCSGRNGDEVGLVAAAREVHGDLPRARLVDLLVEDDERTNGPTSGRM